MGDHESRDRAGKSVNPNATRDHLANERTFLAWARSCIAIMALGFVVARFGLAAPRTPLELSTGFGVALVVCGAVLMILATLRSRATTGAIDRDVYHPSPWLIQLVAGGLVGVATLLAAYLVLTV